MEDHRSRRDRFARCVQNEQTLAVDPFVFLQRFFYHYSNFDWRVAPKLPKRTDLKSILIIGSGPIVIGQACEFDYSGTQACKVLKEEGYRVILVNSNPATIMTDPELADATYVEPIVPEFVEGEAKHAQR